jgi:hypothetical protein
MRCSNCRLDYFHVFIEAIHLAGQPDGGFIGHSLDADANTGHIGMMTLWPRICGKALRNLIPFSMSSTHSSGCRWSG